MIILIMLFLGPIQVIWALVDLCIVDLPQIQKHYLYYGSGVIIYFLILSQLQWSVFSLEKWSVETVYFYLGAWSLAVYHAWINWHKGTIRERNRISNANGNTSEMAA